MEFIKYNNNPKGRKTGDCVVRAISLALNQTWEDTYAQFLDVALETGYAIATKEHFTIYLKQRGYEKQKMPKEFADEIAEKDTTYIVNLANHLTVIKNKNLYDIWDCSRKSVGNFWVISKDVK